MSTSGPGDPSSGPPPIEPLPDSVLDPVFSRSDDWHPVAAGEPVPTYLGAGCGLAVAVLLVAAVVVLIVLL